MVLFESSIHYKSSVLHYAKYGQGKTALLLFHGFGQHHGVFKGWVPQLSTQFTLYLFDLFFHGQSQWNEQEPLQKNDWKNIVSLFLAKEKIPRFALAGFSLGGKFAMTTAEHFPDKVSHLFLLAPDGIKTSAWYSLATYPHVTRGVFKSMIEKPERFFRLIKLAQKLNWVDKGIVRFVENQMNTKEKRALVYNSWVYFRHLKINLSHLAQLLNANSIPVTMIVGKYDKVIVAKNMKLLLDKLANKKLHLIEAGHNDLIAKVGYVIC
jgi:pimeloyl-ACP methyl ester carboxylesterase